jgi:hypothetical protein
LRRPGRAARTFWLDLSSDLSLVISAGRSRGSRTVEATGALMSSGALGQRAKPRVALITPQRAASAAASRLGFASVLQTASKNTQQPLTHSLVHDVRAQQVLHAARDRRARVRQAPLAVRVEQHRAVRRSEREEHVWLFVVPKERRRAALART